MARNRQTCIALCRPSAICHLPFAICHLPFAVFGRGSSGLCPSGDALNRHRLSLSSGPLWRNPLLMTSNRRAFLKQVGVGTAGVGLLSFLPACRTNPQTAGAGKLPRSTPEAQGVSSPGILAFLDAVQHSKHELHSFMFVRHGHVVAEGWWTPYGPQFNHTLYSLSKSFTSTSVGFAVAEGKLHVDDRVVSFFPNDLPEQCQRQPRGAANQGPAHHVRRQRPGADPANGRAAELGPDLPRLAHPQPAGNSVHV